MTQGNSRGVWVISFWLCLGGFGLTSDSNILGNATVDPMLPRPRLQLFVYNYAPVSSGDLKVAKEVAANIYENAGVWVEWLDCYLSKGEFKHNPECGRLTAATLVVRILPRSKAEGLKQPPSALGFAQLDRSGGFGYYANVFYHRVEELSGLWTSSRPVVLGHVIAHEMGHLLLGQGGHARTGLMTADWNRAELERVNQRTFSFTSQQAKEIWARSLQRHSSAEASRLREVAEKRQVGGASDDTESAGRKE
jgi:hypothetical protein